MVASKRKTISSRSSRKLKLILHLLWQHIWTLSLKHATLSFFLFITLCYHLGRAHFEEATYQWVNLLTLWLSKTLEGEWKRNKRYFWVSFVSNFAFLICLFFSRFVFHLGCKCFLYLYLWVCLYNDPPLTTEPQHFPPTFDTYLILDSHKTTFLSYSL